MPDTSSEDVGVLGDGDRALLDAIFGMDARPTYTEEQVIALRERHGVTLPHLSVKAQLAQLKGQARRIARDRAAGKDTSKDEKDLDQKIESVQASAALQSFTDPHLCDSAGYAVAAAPLMHRVEPVSTITTIGTFILRSQAEDLEILWRDYSAALDAHIVRELGNRGDSVAAHERRQAGKRVLSDQEAALPAEEWQEIAAEHELSVDHLRRLIHRAEQIIAQEIKPRA